MPLLDSTSSRTRITSVQEIMDISEKEAKAFLMTVMTKDVAEKVVSTTGGRIIHLIQAISIYRQTESLVERKELPDIINRCLMSRFIKYSITEIKKQPTCRQEMAIIEYLSSQGITAQDGVDVETLDLSCNQWQKEKDGEQKVAKAVEHLISVNVLRYKEDGTVAFHSRLVERYVK